jgi:hypothetical protein
MRLRRGRHQVARHEVTVHIDGRGGQIFGDDGAEHPVQRLTQRAIDRDAAVLCQIPLRKKFQFALEQGFVVSR